MSAAYAGTIKSEKETCRYQTGLLKSDVINCQGEPQSETLIVAPGTGFVYDFMDYRAAWYSCHIKRQQGFFGDYFSPCKSKTSKGLAVGDNLSVAKKLYGNSVKQSLGYASKFYFPEYNLTVKGLKGTLL
jgi:hypothetical protein